MDNTKNAQLKKLIDIMVERKVQAVLEALLPEIMPQMIKECMAGLIMESSVSRPVVNAGNSEKRRALTESSNDGHEEYPTMTGKPFDRSRLAELMGLSQGGMPQLGENGMVAGAAAPGGMITVDKIVTEHGTEIQLPPGAVPNDLLQAFNRDYRPLMNALKARGSQNG